METILPLNAGMDQDTNPLYVKADEGRVIERRNARTISLDGENVGVNVPLKGMLENTDLTTLGRVIGQVEDLKNNAIIVFIAGDAGEGRVYRYYPITDTTEKILDNAYAFFDFSQTGYISADIIGDILIWAEEGNPIRYINLVRAVNFSSGASVDWKDTYQEITDTNTRLSIAPPQTIVTGTFGKDTGVVINNIFNKTFQFALQYKYKDGRKSPVGDFSKLHIYPSLLVNDGSASVDDLYNYISFDVPMVDPEIIGALVLFRDNMTSGWTIALDYDKEDEDDTTLSGYEFFNDANIGTVTLAESIALNDGVPKSATQVLLAQNRALIGDPVDGFDKHEDTSISATPTVRTISSSTYLDDIAANSVGGSNNKQMTITFPTITAGEVIVFDLKGTQSFDVSVAGDDNNFILHSEFALTKTYLIQTGDTINDIVDFLFKGTITPSGEGIVFSHFLDERGTQNPAGVEYSTVAAVSHVSGSSVVTIDFTLSFTGEVSAVVEATEDTVCQPFSDAGYIRDDNVAIDEIINSFVPTSKYIVGIEYEDADGRSGGVTAKKEVTVEVVAPALDYLGVGTTPVGLTGRAYGINCVLSGTPPSWAARYRMVVSKSISYSNLFSFGVLKRETKPTLGLATLKNKIYYTNFNGKSAAAIQIPDGIDYVFADGDFVSFSRLVALLQTEYVNGIKVLGTATQIKTNDGYGSFQEDKTLTGFFLIIEPNISSLSGLILSDIAIQVYRPLTPSGETIFYRDYKSYAVTAGAHTTTNINLTNGDAWAILNRYTLPNADKTDNAETDGYSNEYVWTFFPSFFIKGIERYSQGKPTLELTEFKEKQLSQVWFGGKFFEDTQINDLNDFSNKGVIDVDSVFGDINGMAYIGDTIKIIQGNKETSVYIGKDGILSANGNIQTVRTDDFVGTTNLSETNHGSKYPRSIIVNDRDMYFWDGDRGEIIRSAPNGQIPISSNEMGSYFHGKKDAINTAIAAGEFADVQCVFDRRHSELIVIFATGDGSSRVTEAVIFSELTKQWMFFADYYKTISTVNTQPDIMGAVGEEVVSFMNSDIYVHDKTSTYNSIYGSARDFSLTGLANVSPANEKTPKALKIDSSRTFAIQINTDIASTRTLGHKTVLYEASLIPIEGGYYSSVYGNILTTAGDDLNLLHNGDDVRGRFFRILVTGSVTGDFELRNIGVTYLIAD